MSQEKLITLDNLGTFKDKLDVRVNKLVAFNDQNLADNPDVTLTSETAVKIASFDATIFDSLPSTFYFKVEIVEETNKINVVCHYKDGSPSVGNRYTLYSGGVNTFSIDNTDNNIASVDVEGYAGTYFNMMFCVNQNAAYTPYYLSNRQLTHEIRNVSGLELGETSTTAYRGDRGKTAYNHSQSDHSNIAPAFSEASTRTNIASGESFATILGKIKKWFSDLKTVAFTGSYTDLTNKPTIPSDVNVKQTPTTTNANYEVLFSGTADNITREEQARKSSGLKFNPSTGNLQSTQLNGVDIGSSPKFTDTTTGTSYNAGSCPDNTTFATNGSVARTYSMLNGKIKTYTAYGSITKGSELAAGGEWHPTISNIPSGYLLDTLSLSVISPAAYCIPSIDKDGIGTTSITLWVKNIHTSKALNVTIYWSVEVPY